MSRSRTLRTIVAALVLAVSARNLPSAHATDAPRKRPVPCTAPEYRQFDFWIGDWSVTTRDGKFAGTNLITRPLGECVIQEHWAGSQGGKGESYNVYDAARGVWHQTWVDDSGNTLLLDGHFENGRMVLSGTQTASGKPVINRITWTPVKPGEVEQLWESSTDDGKTWTEQFLGIYRPRKK